MRKPDTNIRLAVTGIGIICSIGSNAEEVWAAIEQSRGGIGPLTTFGDEKFTTDIAAEVHADFASDLFEHGSEMKRLSRTDLLAIKAAGEAVSQADLGATTPVPRERTVVCTGTSTGGLLEGESYFFERLIRGAEKTSASRVLQQPTSGPSDAVAKTLQLGGGVLSNATACASGGAAIGMAADLLRSGHVDSALAGGSDALCRLTYSGFNVLGAVDPAPCTPFGADRKGITLGEGAAYIVLERWDDAVARGARILAELGGYGASCDAHHPTAPVEDGRGAAAAMRGALRDGGSMESEVDYINAHGTGTLLNDSAETRAILSTVGSEVPASSTKSFFGHTLGAAGGLEAVITVMALQHQLAPPTLRLYSRAEDCTLDYVPLTPRPMAMKQALSNTFGFGGSNVSLLFRAS